MVTLLCLFNGEASDKAFPVSITTSSTVADLENAIRLVHPVLKETAPLRLTLWRVSIPRNRIVKGIIQLPPGRWRKRLHCRNRINRIFTTQPVEGNVHIMIEPPKSLFMKFPQRFKIFVSPQKVRFQWAVYVGRAIFSDLKNAIQAEDSAIEISDETAITYTATNDVKCFITDNSNLQELLITRAARQYCMLNLNLETPQKPFTDYTFPMVCGLFGFSTARNPDFDIFPPFEYGNAPDHLLSGRALYHLLAELDYRMATTGLGSSSEANSSHCVSSFLVVAASVLPNDTIINPQKQLQGRYGRGPVDFALESKASGGFIGVTQVTRQDFRRGIAQSIVQLEASLSNRKRELTETADTPTPPCRAFGLVTDASVWYILECIMDSDERISVKMSKMVPVIVYSQEGWEKKVEDVLSHLVWLLQQIETEDAN